MFEDWKEHWRNSRRAGAALKLADFVLLPALIVHSLAMADLADLPVGALVMALAILRPRPACDALPDPAGAAPGRGRSMGGAATCT